jgi:hypothetical protein
MKNLTQTHISFLSTINRNFEVDKSEKYQYWNLYKIELKNWAYFISKIKEDEIILVFPFITTTERPTDPYLRLSDQFLVTNKSNPELITEYLNSQWINCDFDIVENRDYWLYIKYKIVSLHLIKY